MDRYMLKQAMNYDYAMRRYRKLTQKPKTENPGTQLKVCISGKIQYPDKKIASQAANKLKDIKNVYLCPDCNNWHISRMTLKEVNNYKRSNKPTTYIPGKGKSKNIY